MTTPWDFAISEAKDEETEAAIARYMRDPYFYRFISLVESLVVRNNRGELLTLMNRIVPKETTVVESPSAVEFVRIESLFVQCSRCREVLVKHGLAHTTCPIVYTFDTRSSVSHQCAGKLVPISTGDIMVRVDPSKGNGSS